MKAFGSKCMEDCRLVFPESQMHTGGQDARKGETCNEQQLTLIGREYLLHHGAFTTDQVLYTGYMIFLNESSQETEIQNRTPICHTSTVIRFNPLRRRYSTNLQRSSGKADNVPYHCWFDFC